MFSIDFLRWLALMTVQKQAPRSGLFLFICTAVGIHGAVDCIANVHRDRIGRAVLILVVFGVCVCVCLCVCGCVCVCIVYVCIVSMLECLFVTWRVIGFDRAAFVHGCVIFRVL